MASGNGADGRDSGAGHERGVAPRPIIIALVGAESTGKSWLAQRLSTHFDCATLPEYGRDYCEKHGNAVSMAELVHIGQTQEQMIRLALIDAADNDQRYVITDTDALVTAIWADVMYGARDPWFAQPRLLADIYLVTSNDVAWEYDGIRLFSRDAERADFRARIIAEIVAHGGRWAPVSGDRADRVACAVAAIAAFTQPTG